MSTKDAPDIIAEAITPYQRVKISGLHIEPNRREFFRPILTSFLEQWMQTEPVIYWSDEAGTEPGPPTRPRTATDADDDPPETLPEAVSRLGDWVHQASGDLGQSIREAALISIAPASLPKDWSLEGLASFVVGASHAIDAEAIRRAKDADGEGGET